MKSLLSNFLKMCLGEGDEEPDQEPERSWGELWFFLVAVLFIVGMLVAIKL